MGLDVMEGKEHTCAHKDPRALLTFSSSGALFNF